MPMSRGKLAAQVAHAAVSAAEECRKSHPEWFSAWFEEGQCKIVLGVDGEEELVAIYEKAKSLGLPASLVVDRGLTEIPPGTKTCVGIGPAPSERVDEVTGHLRLLR